MTLPPEAEIIINGHKLTQGESMAVRVAVTDLWIEMSDPDALGTDDMGRSITQGYHRNSESVLAKILENVG